MSNYSNESVHDRLNGLAGKPAEQAFELVMAERGRIIDQNLFRFGFDKGDTENRVIPTLPRILRHAPDYISAGGHMWEVQGCGQDRTFTFKEEKLADLLAWGQFINRRVRWGLFIQPDQSMLLATMDAVLWAIQQPEAEHVVLDADERNPKPAWRVPVEVLLRREVKDAFAADVRAYGGHNAPEV